MNTTDKITALRDALTKIEKWHDEFPPTGQTWDDGSTMSYAAAFGSNGERDYMRGVASQAIAMTADASEDTPDCCDTPNYCSSVRRCTTKDEAPGMVFDPLARHDEQKLRAMLADLHREYRDRAEPLVKHLVAIEALKPPAPLIIDWPAAPAAPIAEEAAHDWAARGYVVGATVEKDAGKPWASRAVIHHVHPNGALDVWSEGIPYGWSAHFCKPVAP